MENHEDDDDDENDDENDDDDDDGDVIDDDHDDEGCWWRAEQLHRIYSRGAAASFALPGSHLGQIIIISPLGQIIIITTLIWTFLSVAISKEKVPRT